QFTGTGHAEPKPAPLALLSAEDVGAMVVLVTGSTRGIGRAVAAAFAQAGAFVVVNGRDAGAVEQACAEIGPAALGVPADVSTEDGVEALVGAALERFGRIDVVVNNAGVALATGKPAWEVSPDELRE